MVTIIDERASMRDRRESARQSASLVYVTSMRPWTEPLQDATHSANSHLGEAHQRAKELARVRRLVRLDLLARQTRRLTERDTRFIIANVFLPRAVDCSLGDALRIRHRASDERLPDPPAPAPPNLMTAPLPRSIPPF